MLFKAKEKDRDRSTRFLASDCDELPFKEFLFDSVFSNLTYQWVPDIDASFREVWRVLKPGGLFLFSILGPRTLEELQVSYKKTGDAAGNNGRFVPMEFHDVENLSSNLKKTGFEILKMESVVKNKNYKNLWDLLRTLKATGASPPLHNGNKSLARGFFLKETAKTYQKYFPASNGTGILATYDIIYVAAKKSTSPFKK
jgi:malonyl-CoA O-methyltransferase